VRSGEPELITRMAGAAEHWHCTAAWSGKQQQLSTGLEGNPAGS